MGDTSDYIRRRSAELKEMRTKAGISIADLSAASGISQQTIFRMESGENGWNTLTEHLYLASLDKLEKDMAEGKAAGGA